MPNTPLLPLLKTDRDVADLDVAGVWEDRGPIELEHISNSIEVTTPSADYSEIDSIPNMWARPLLFEMALYDDQHPIHERIVGEWRGLLAMLALKECYNFPLTIEPIEIPAENDLEVPEFLQALWKLRPQQTLHADTPWEQLYLILFDNNPIGLTSPTTLLCTAADCFGYIADVPWCHGEFLYDPTEQEEDFSGLLPEHKAAVAGWLQHLRDEQIDPIPQSHLKERILTRINEFSDALGGIPEETVPLSKHGFGLDHGLFQGMNHPVAAEDFFTEKLFVIKQENAFHRGEIRQPEGNGEPDEVGVLSPRGSDNLHFDGEVTPILPIKKELLADPNMTNLNERIVFEQRATGIVVKLRLPVTGSDEQNHDFVIAKEYRFNNQEDVNSPTTGPGEIVSIPFVPVLEVWPNFKKSDWNVYYTYFTTANRNTFYAKPFPPDKKPDFRSFDNKELTKTSRPPEAMLCEYKGTEAGVLLISIPELEPDGEGTWTVGVDFGTTSTTIYRNDQRDNPKAMQFGSRLLQVTDSGTARGRLYDDFIPAAPEPTPFLSLFQSFSSPEKNLKPLLDGHIYFLLDYNQFRDAGNIVSNLKWSSKPADRIRTQVFLEQLCLQCAAEAAVGGAGEINWRFSFPIAFSDNDKQTFQDYWTRVTRACETATTDLQPEELQSNVSSEPESIVTAKFFARTLPHELATGAFASGAVCIDIGGETSDISIWQDNKLYCQTSLRFAGRHIFLDRLKKNPRFLGIFGVDPEKIEPLEIAANEDESAFYAHADSWIDELNALIDSQNRDSEQDTENNWWQNRLHYADRPEVKTFVQLIATGVSGLLYYVGLVLNYLGQTSKFRPEMPSVYIGGNGSRILHWLANDRFGPDSPSQVLLKQVILNASGFQSDDSFDLAISPEPKHEAAFGLVDEETILEWDKGEFGLILAGEAFTADGIFHDWTEELTAQQLVKVTDLKAEEELKQIANFVSSFNTHAGPGEAIKIPIELKAKDYQFIGNQLQNWLTNLSKRNDPQDLHVEPLFIMALKHLLNRQTEQWVRKQRNV